MFVLEDLGQVVADQSIGVGGDVLERDGDLTPLVDRPFPDHEGGESFLPVVESQHELQGGADGDALRRGKGRTSPRPRSDRAGRPGRPFRRPPRGSAALGGDALVLAPLQGVRDGGHRLDSCDRLLDHGVQGGDRGPLQGASSDSWVVSRPIPATPSVMPVITLAIAATSRSSPDRVAVICRSTRSWWRPGP